jgi:hypothetical protein
MATALAGARLQQLEVAEAACRSMEGVIGSSGTRVGGCRLKDFTSVSRSVRVPGPLAKLSGLKEYNFEVAGWLHILCRGLGFGMLRN